MLTILSGQTADGPKSADDPNSWIGKHLLAEAADYTVLVQQDAEQLTELVFEEPLLRYYDPLTNVPDGYFLVWTRDQRPEACATFWVHQLPGGLRELHEFQSLSERPIRARRGETDVWRPDATGVEWRTLPDAPAPASVEALRLTQMRQQARRFSAAIRDGTGRRQLRLLAQPVYRYACPEEHVLDGALFVFAKGTNPELLVLLEARGADDGPFWHVATARMTIRRIEVQLDDEDLETKSALGGRTPYLDPEQPYYEFRRPLQPPAEIPPSESQ
jgi:hypothetical protein